MIILVLFVALVGVSQSESYRAFKSASNSNPHYRLVAPTPCETGARRSGYALAPGGRVFLKQVGRDGTVGPVCRDAP
jgi:hypothetical protein